MASQNGDSLQSLSEQILSLKKDVGLIKAKQLRSRTVQDKAKAVVQQYFRIVRPELKQMKIEPVEADQLVQDLNELASRGSLTSLYKVLIKKLERELPKMEIKRELSISDSQFRGNIGDGQTEIDRKIIATLADLVPPAALSYQQALIDLKDETKVSYRGTAAELREVLRETLDALAPDKEVEASSGFAYEKDAKGNPLPTPTMKQKVRFVLKSRGQSKTAIKTPESAVAIIEEHVASFARSTYDRGSLSTHQLTKRPEAQKLKGYVETVLCELLEIY